jgi:tetratricopeptide (TPR) repeat protein
MNDPASPSCPAPAHAPSRSWGWRRFALVLLPLLLVLAVGLGWKFRSRARAVEPPALDPAGVDPAVWRVIERGREHVRQEPGSPRAWGRLGMLFLAHALPTEAETCLARAEQLAPSDVRWPYYRALAVIDADPESAIDHLRRAVAGHGPEEEMPWLLLGELLLQSGQVDEAEKTFRVLLAQDPSNSRAHLGLARLALQQDDLPASLRHLSAAETAPHTRKAAAALVAQVRQRRGDQAGADEARRHAESLPDDEDWPDPLREQVEHLRVGRQGDRQHAYELFQQDRLSEAIALLRRTLQDYPDASGDWLFLGQLLLRRQDVPAAEKAFRTAIEKDPKSAEAHFYLGAVLSHQAKWDEAAACFRQATKLKPDYAEAYSQLGHCLKRKGDRAGALAAFRMAVGCQPQLADAQAQLGELLAEDGQLEAALTHLRLAVQYAPEDAHTRQLLESVRQRSDRVTPTGGDTPPDQPK